MGPQESDTTWRVTQSTKSSSPSGSQVSGGEWVQRTQPADCSVSPGQWPVDSRHCHLWEALEGGSPAPRETRNPGITKHA